MPSYISIESLLRKSNIHYIVHANQIIGLKKVCPTMTGGVGVCAGAPKDHDAVNPPKLMVASDENHKSIKPVLDETTGMVA